MKGLLTLTAQGTLVVLCALCTACNALLPNCREAYHAHQWPLLSSSARMPRTEGYYISLDGQGCFAIYGNGRFKKVSLVMPDGKAFWAASETERMRLIESASIRPGDGWGDFSVDGDHFRGQFFNRNIDEVCVRNVFEYQGLVLNDSTIAVQSIYMHWKGETFMNTPNTFRFFPTEQRPDQSCSWLYTKSWYRNKLHFSRM